MAEITVSKIYSVYNAADKAAFIELKNELKTIVGVEKLPIADVIRALEPELETPEYLKDH